MTKGIDDTNSGFGGLPLSDVGLCDGTMWALGMNLGVGAKFRPLDMHA